MPRFALPGRLFAASVLALLSLVMSACAGRTHAMTPRQYCRQFAALDKQFNPKFAAAWREHVDLNNITPQLERQVPLEIARLKKLQQIPAPPSERPLVARYLAIQAEIVRRDTVYLDRYRADKSAQRNTVALFGQLRRVAAELGAGCS
jgi:hypothetical protein